MLDKWQRQRTGRALHPRHWPSVWVLGVWCVVLGVWSCAPPRLVEAHSGPPYVVIESRAVGRYMVTVWADPDVGSGSFIVEATVSGAAPAAQTTISIFTQRANGRAAISASAQRESYDPKMFLAYVPFDAEGTWHTRLLLDGPAGRGEVVFEILVTPPYPSWLLTLLCLLPFIGVGLLWLRAVRRQQQAGVAILPES